MLKIMRQNIIRPGRLLAMSGRTRWVEGAHYYFDASEIPAHWHRWLTYVGDEVPTEEMKTRIKFSVPHKPNMTGTPLAYKPPGYQFQKHTKDFQQEDDLSFGAQEMNAEMSKRKKD